MEIKTKPRQQKKDDNVEKIMMWFFVILLCFICGLSVIRYGMISENGQQVPEIEVTSMDFTVHSIRQTRLSATWDLLVRIPSSLHDDYICLQGDIQASISYKTIDFVTSSPQRYDLKPNRPQQLRVSASISEKDIGGLIEKNIIKDIKENKEVKFGSRLFLTDCRKNSTGVMSYVCGETTLRFEPGSEMKTLFGNIWFEPEMKATSIRNKSNPTCTNY